MAKTSLDRLLEWTLTHEELCKQRAAKARELTTIRRRINNVQANISRISKQIEKERKKNGHNAPSGQAARSMDHRNSSQRFLDHLAGDRGETSKEEDQPCHGI